MSNLQKVLIIIILSVAVIFVSGVLLPKYLSSQILELRKELNSQNNDSKYSLQANLVPVAEKHTQNESKDFMPSLKVEGTEKFLTVLANNSIQSRAKRKKRSKRQAMSKEQHVIWNLNLTLTEKRNPTLQETSENASDTSHRFKNLDIGIYNKGEASKQYVMEDTFFFARLAEWYFKKMYQYIGNLTDEGEKKHKLVDVDGDFDMFDAGGSGNEPMRGREGKLFNLNSFNIFSFLKSPKNAQSSISTTPETDSVFKNDDLMRTTQSPLSPTENSQETPNLSNLQAQSLVSEALSLVSNISSSNLPGKTEDGECIDCDAVGLESAITSNTEDLTKYGASETVTKSNEFTDEFLEMFCTRLGNTLGISHHLSDTEGINEPKQNIINVLKSPKNPAFDEFQTSVSEKELNLDFFTENSLLSSDALASENGLRQKKFLGFDFFFGSGRAAADQDESNDLTSEKFADVADLKNLPTRLDCENFRKKSINIFPESSVINISHPKTQPADFANTTISELAEQQLQYLTSLPKKNLDNSIKIYGENSDDTETKSASDEMTIDIEASTLNEVPNKIFLRTEPNDLNWDAKMLLTSTDIDVQLTTELQRDSRFLNILGMLGIGSGNGESRSLDTEVFDNDGNKALEIDDLKSFGAVAFGTDESKFISDDSRSLGTALFGTNRNEFGSGDSRSLGAATFGIESNEFGSGGESRSFKDADFSLETNGFGSGDSFKESLRLTSSNKQQFFGLAGSGDGRDLSGILEVSHVENKCGNNCSFEITTEQLYDCDDYGCDYENSSDADSSILDNPDLTNDKGCHGACPDVSVDTRNEYGQTEENGIVLVQTDGMVQTDKKVTPESFQKTFSSNEPIEFVSVTSKLLENEPGTPVVSGEDLRGMNESTLEKNSFSECDECDYSISNFSDEFQHTIPTDELFGKNTNQGKADENLETSSDLSSTSDHSNEGSINSEKQNVIESPLEKTTEINTRRFLETIFLTGSGDDGLFGNNGGPINLVEEEESTIVSQSFSLRKARLDDIPLNFSEVMNESVLNQSKQESTFDGDAVKGKVASPVIPVRRTGRVDDMDERCDDCEYDYEDFILKNQNSVNSDTKDINFKKRIKTQSDGEMPVTNEEKIPVTVSSDVIRSNYPILVDLTKESKIPSHPCTAAKECNVTLNERCITINSTRVCGCSKGYTRNKETRKCIVKKIVETSLKLPAEEFEEDLKNPFSPSFQQKKKSSIEMMMLLLQNDPDLLRILSEINVIEFSAGSLVITLNLVFAVENKSEAQLIKYVEDDLQIALRDERLRNSVSFDISEASLLSVNGEIDYCKSSELNYCSEQAYCVSNAALPGGYSCHCKEHYRDVSLDPRHIGETCLAKCPREYCGLYGHCELLANDEKICLCSGLYFGRRCEVPGLYVLIILGLLGFISLTMLLLVIFKRRCSKFSYTESQAHGSEENGTHSHMNGRVSDAIALEENIGRAKFMTISTPMPHPAIKITRATKSESVSSYDFDSTFDSSQSIQKTEGNSIV